MTEKTLEEMMAEFHAKGGQVTKVEPSEFGAPSSALGKLCDIETFEHGEGRRQSERVVWVVYLFELKKTVRMMTRAEDRMGIEKNKNYRFSFRAHLGGKHIRNGIDYVTRGRPIKMKPKEAAPEFRS